MLGLVKKVSPIPGLIVQKQSKELQIIKELVLILSGTINIFF